MSAAERAAVEQAAAFNAQGRHRDAEDLLRRSLRRGASPQVDNALAITLVQQGRLTEAAFHAERAAAGGAAFAQTLGNVLLLMGKPEPAAAALAKAVVAAPMEPGLRLAIANALRQVGRLSEALEHIEAGEALAPTTPIRATRAEILSRLGRHAESWALIGEVARDAPDDLRVLGGRANLSNYVPELPVADVRAAHDAFGRALRARTPDAPPPPTPRDPERPLRVGLLSGDLRQHSVAYFIEPLLEHIPLERMTVHAYTLHAQDDAVSLRLKGHCTGWTSVHALSDEGIARRIRDDAIDILIDLMGHTQGSRLEVFQRRPAPLQVSYLGYPNITGVDAIDVRLCDAITDPPHADEPPRGPERLVRLPGPMVCYRPDPAAPEPRRDPAIPGPTFASFNIARKLNDPVLDAWARVLIAAPNARLILKSSDMRDARAADLWRGRFAARGIDPARVEVLHATPGIAAHLALYDRVDVALDPFPYHGTTTTCEALWQGVPVVTLVGDRHASRVGASLLNAVGLGDLAASDVDAYVALAVRAAQDPRFADRGGLRERVRRSPLCDGPRAAAGFAETLRSLWRSACG